MVGEAFIFAFSHRLANYFNASRARSTQARQLLKEASDGVNPFEGFTPKLADGESLVFGTEEFDMMEAEGLKAAAKTGFVLVSGHDKAGDAGAACMHSWEVHVQALFTTW